LLYKGVSLWKSRSGLFKSPLPETSFGGQSNSLPVKLWT
jgi:hypothetical protein